jgi:predicted nucleic acid-binding protein
VRVLFDTSVLVTAVVDQLSNHEASLACLAQSLEGPREGCCAAHALAEAYATLTALPLPRRIQPADARRLIEENFSGRLRVIGLRRADYAEAIRRVSDLGLGSGAVYDALHAVAAEKASCRRIYTYNLSHFQRLGPRGITVTAP